MGGDLSGGRPFMDGDLSIGHPFMDGDLSIGHPFMDGDLSIGHLWTGICRSAIYGRGSVDRPPTLWTGICRSTAHSMDGDLSIGRPSMDGDLSGGPASPARPDRLLPWGGGGRFLSAPAQEPR